MKYQLCKISEIKDPGSKEFEVNNGPLTESLFIINKDGNLHAYLNSCPHTGSPLNWQLDEFLDREKQYIQCAVHDALFEITNGRCLAGPCVNESLKRLELEIDDENIYVTLD